MTTDKKDPNFECVWEHLHGDMNIGQEEAIQALVDLRFNYKAEIEMASVTIAALRSVLENANEICRSAFSIAGREGNTTNWEAFYSRTKESLALQHRTLFPGQ